MSRIFPSTRLDGRGIPRPRFCRAFATPTRLFIYRRPRVRAYTHAGVAYAFSSSLFSSLSLSPFSLPPCCVTHNEASNRARYAQSRRRLGRLRLEVRRKERKGEKKERKRKASVKEEPARIYGACRRIVYFSPGKS